MMLVAGLRNASPNHFQRHFTISLSAGFCLVHCHSSSILIVSGLHITSSFLRQSLVKACILLLITIVVHVSTLYNKTALTILVVGVSLERNLIQGGGTNPPPFSPRFPTGIGGVPLLRGS